MIRRTTLTYLLAICATTAIPSTVGFVSRPSWVVCSRSNTNNGAISMSSVAAAPEAMSSYEKAMEKMKMKDESSKSMSKSDLNVIFEDKHIIVVEKPAGVLSVPNKNGNPSLAQTVYDAYGCESNNVDKMVAQRLGFDTSGLIVFARTNVAIKRLNKQLREKFMKREYEALVCGTVSNDSGEITYDLTRDADALPYMRIHNKDAQRKLIELAKDLPIEVATKFCQREKKSVTRYTVTAREELEGNPVTRLALTSVTGRTHQLNVHCAAIGHPIVGDSTYGIDGDATPNGGVESGDLPNDAASTDVQTSIASLGKGLCVHLTKLSFSHPISREKLSFESKPSF